MDNVIKALQEQLDCINEAITYTEELDQAGYKRYTILLRHRRKLRKMLNRAYKMHSQLTASPRRHHKEGAKVKSLVTKM